MLSRDMAALNGNFFRTLLVLGRVSNVPTVWSNCLAAWLLADGGGWWRLGAVIVGATLLYVGGMYLNDAFDTAFDAQHRRERPIPSGQISERAVWQIGCLLLGIGFAVFCLLGFWTGFVAFLLVASIVVYDATHKLVAFSPLLMALCRFLLYMVAASAARMGITGTAMWSGLALGAYIVGVSCLAKRESTGAVVRAWPLLLLAVPILLAFIVNDGVLRQNAIALSAILLLWCVRSLRPALSAQRNLGRAVGSLLAGIVWVDLLAVANAPREVSFVFLGLFLLALLFQRYVPAT